MRSRISLVLALVCGLLVREVAACLWTYATNLEGHVEWVMSGPPEQFAESLVQKQSRQFYREHAVRLKRRAEEQPEKHELRNDYAVMLARAGEFAEALVVLNDIEATKPGLYPTAANLGTVYELSGDVEKSLHWIQGGLARNPQSHNGSEWLHVRILKAKQQLAADPDWLKTHSILGLDFGNEARPHQPTDEEIAVLSGVSEHGDSQLGLLNYHMRVQLEERTSLINAPDPIVADLLFDLCNVLALQGPLENAIAIGELAQRYELPRDELLQLRLQHFRKLVREADKPLLSPNQRLELGIISFLIFFSLSLLAFVVLVVWWFRRWRRRKKLAQGSPLG